MELEKHENYVVFTKQKRKKFIISEKTAKSLELEQSGVLDSKLSSLNKFSGISWLFLSKKNTYRNNFRKKSFGIFKIHDENF